VSADSLGKLGVMFAGSLSKSSEEQALLPEDELLQAFMAGLFDGVILIGRNGSIRAVNPAVETIFGCRACELIGRDASSLVPFETNQTAGSAAPARPEEATRGRELTGRRHDGTPFPMALNLSEFVLGAEPVKVAVVRDLTEHKQAEKTIRELALYDALTGLANRGLFRRSLEDAFRSAGVHGRLVGLMLLNLDDFKSINDNYGHSVGDLLLRHVAGRIESITRKRDAVARLGSDEFAIVMDDLEWPDEIHRLAARILEDLSQPVTLDGCLLKTGASMGISVCPLDDTNPDELIRKAGMALNETKSGRRGGYHFYNRIMDAQARATSVLETELRLALVRREFQLHYQPKLCIDGCRVVGAEALIRWQHPGRGMVPPGEFIPVAESSDLMLPLGEWVLREACEQARAWQRAGVPSLPVAVNISARQFQDSDFVAALRDILRETGLDPSLLELEITEGMVMDDTEQMIEKFHAIHDLGVEISIDDFGTGYSSLAYLKRFPVHRLT
jgi:diguanylate cyclase (GGDEF)-like protein/PAS domain S-box-containing protein